MSIRRVPEPTFPTFPRAEIAALMAETSDQSASQLVGAE